MYLKEVLLEKNANYLLKIKQLITILPTIITQLMRQRGRKRKGRERKIKIKNKKQRPKQTE